MTLVLEVLILARVEADLEWTLWATGKAVYLDAPRRCAMLRSLIEVRDEWTLRVVGTCQSGQWCKRLTEVKTCWSRSYVISFIAIRNWTWEPWLTEQDTERTVGCRYKVDRHIGLWLVHVKFHCYENPSRECALHLIVRKPITMMTRRSEDQMGQNRRREAYKRKSYSGLSSPYICWPIDIKTCRGRLAFSTQVARSSNYRLINVVASPTKGRNLTIQRP